MTQVNSNQSGASHDWMRGVLNYLFDECTPSQVKVAVSDDNALHEIQETAGHVLAPDIRLQMPGGDQGDNLWRALIALRIKFSREEANAKLEKNLQLRSQT